MTVGLNLDVSAEEARALHRVVRAMHDGHCPNCGHIGRAETFIEREGWFWLNHDLDEKGCRPTGAKKCPQCKFLITAEEVRDALQQFQPYLQRSVQIFEKWREKRES